MLSILGLFHPLLPRTSNGRLKFPLCAKCGDAEDTKGCHCSDDERALSGTWTSMELQKALDLGYQLMNIQEVYHYAESAQYNKAEGQTGIFSEFIDFFLRLKQEASDYPTWVKNASNVEEAKQRYIDTYWAHEGIWLDKENIKKNPGMRSLAKLLLNSFWVSSPV